MRSLNPEEKAGLKTRELSWLLRRAVAGEDFGLAELAFEQLVADQGRFPIDCWTKFTGGEAYLQNLGWFRLLAGDPAGAFEAWFRVFNESPQHWGRPSNRSALQLPLWIVGRIRFGIPTLSKSDRNALPREKQLFLMAFIDLTEANDLERFVKLSRRAQQFEATFEKVLHYCRHYRERYWVRVRRRRLIDRTLERTPPRRNSEEDRRLRYLLPVQLAEGYEVTPLAYDKEQLEVGAHLLNERSAGQIQNLSGRLLRAVPMSRADIREANKALYGELREVNEHPH